MNPPGIALYGHDPMSLYGTAAMLGLEKIPYRTVERLEDVTPDELVVVAGELARAELPRLIRMRALVLNGGPHFAALTFGRVGSVIERPVMLTLDSNSWPAELATRFARFGEALVNIPSAPICRIDATGIGKSAGILLNAEFSQPAVLRDSHCVWSTLDIGGAFARLMSESYSAPSKDSENDWLQRITLQHSLQSLYYNAPQWMRRHVQRFLYHRANRRLRTLPWSAAEYPADSTGSLLIEVFKGLIVMAAGSLVRLAHWPAPFRSAALMTHDIEPSSYAYSRGIERLLDRQSSEDHPIFGLVAESSARDLDPRIIARLSNHDVLCHGLTHRTEITRGPAVVDSLRQAKKLLEQRLGRPIVGYRSPRLDRSSDLLAALDSCGFEYDSSYPDTDRENLAHYGAGVRMNLPYRPPIESGDGHMRASRCLELPLAAPDCIQPLFAGESVEQLEEHVRRKAEAVRRCAGLHVALVHAGVFGDDDAERREHHRRFVVGQLQAPGTWRPRVGELLQWWRTREELQLRWDGWSLRVNNPSRDGIHRLRAVIEEPDGERSAALPRVESGASVDIALRYLVAASGTQRPTVLQP